MSGARHHRDHAGATRRGSGCWRTNAWRMATPATQTSAGRHQSVTESRHAEDDSGIRRRRDRERDEHDASARRRAPLPTRAVIAPAFSACARYGATRRVLPRLGRARDPRRGCVEASARRSRSRRAAGDRRPDGQRDAEKLADDRHVVGMTHPAVRPGGDERRIGRHEHAEVQRTRATRWPNLQRLGEAEDASPEISTSRGAGPVDRAFDRHRQNHAGYAHRMVRSHRRAARRRRASAADARCAPRAPPRPP